MSKAYTGPLEKIDDFRWRIPKSYQQGMRVDGLIYANDTLIEQIKKDNALQQVANVATLPGIVKYSLAMPDAHWGYGFPIGGVAATDVDNGGVISPGGVGFDINCLSGNSFILNELGYKIKIKDYEKSFIQHSLRCMDFNKDNEDFTKVLYFLKRKAKKVFTILTEAGKQIEATEDHPFYTRDGMKRLGDLSIGDELAIYPFEGVEHEKPSSEIIVNKENLKELLLKLEKTSRGNAINQILAYLEKKNILPLRYNSPQLPHLIKVIGYCLGDGVLYCEKERNRLVTVLYGKEEDLFNIKRDLERIEFKSNIYSRDRKHKIKTKYSTCEFETKEFSLRVPSMGFSLLLVALGMPIGNKCRQPYNVPKWLFKAPLWQKRLFLAGLFGAELSSSKTVTGHDHNFYAPILSMNKTEAFIKNGRKFLDDISKLLSEFGVKTNKISERLEFINDNNLISYRLRLILSSKSENLINLYGRVGYEYSKKRQFLANIACQYLRLKEKVIKEKKEAANLAPVLTKQRNWSPGNVYKYLESANVCKRFLERSLYEPRATAPRIWGNIPYFSEFKKTNTEGLGASGMVWDKIEEIIDIEHNDWVYDFTVKHPHHNFIANGFVVSNCGVRLLRTNLFEQDVKKKQQDLAYGIYNKVPAGVGSTGKIKVSAKEERQILIKGSKWALSKGFATENDIEHTEEKGAIEGADPDAVSDRAYERGMRQSGTLGSGNHFIEVQAVTDIYDEEAARVFGLEKGQVTVMIHSGSRGFGYQICDDYSKDMVRILSKYNITVPDRQLACAPVNSEEGKRYLGAMRCAANYAWNNRQCLMHLVRLTFEKVFNKSFSNLGMSLIYDVAHNIAKIERHNVDGKEMTLCIHRKGATRAFAGQPIIIPGDMGTYSYLLIGTQQAMDETFGSTCHGAGRCMSRKAAAKGCNVQQLRKEMDQKGIVVMAKGRGTIAEEAPMAYKDVNEVVGVVHNAGISKRVCRMRPLVVLKG